MAIAEVEKRPFVILLRIAMVFVAVLACNQTAAAAPQDIMLFADRDLGESFTSGLQNATAGTNQPNVRPFAIDAACATNLGPAPRLALLARMPTHAQIERCMRNADAEVHSVAIGHQAVALVAPIGAPVWSMDTGSIYRALGQNSAEGLRARVWSDVDPSYPSLPIGLLLPTATSRVQSLFNALILVPGCESSARPSSQLPFALTARSGFCSTLRTDIPITRRDGGADDVAHWAASAPPGHLAVVTVAELAKLDRQVVPLLLDGVLPTADNIGSGRYPVTEQVELLIVLPHDADTAQRKASKDAAFKLLAEASIGPSGALAPVGLIPLSPSERVTARSQTVAFMDQR